MTSFVIYPNFNSCTSSGTFSTPQYSCAFSQLECTSFPPCYAFCGLAIHTASLFFFLFLSTSIFGHFHLQCPTPQHQKHFTSPTLSCCFISTSSFTLHCIILLAITSNLFWGINFPFASPILFLQLRARYPNLLHPQHILLSFSSISALSLARAHHWLSIPLMRELYCSRDIVRTQTETSQNYSQSELTRRTQQSSH